MTWVIVIFFWTAFFTILISRKRLTRNAALVCSTRNAAPAYSVHSTVKSRAGVWLVALGAAVLGLPDAAYAVDRGWARGRVLVKMRAGVSAAEADALLARFKGKRSAKLIDRLRTQVVNLPLAANEPVVADLLSRDPRVEFAEVDRIVEPDLIANDTYYSSAWHLSKIGAPSAWDYADGSGVTIAILDSGVDGSHPDLAPLMVPGWNLYSNNSDTSDVYGHGTKVAGAAAAASNNGAGVAAIAWQAKIMPLRVSLPDGSAYLSTIAAGITWAADHGARIANASYQSVAGSASIQSAANYMKSKGGIVVVSAGNTSGLQSFAASDALIAVSATDGTDARAGWSSYGAYVDVAAPGTGIWSTVRGGTYGAVSGTSFSAPITAGVIALMMSANRALNPTQIETLLKSTAVDLGSAGWDQYFGAGRINAAAAVLAARGGAPSDTLAPSVSITAPTGGTVKGLVSVNASASDNVGIAKVELYAKGALVGTDTSAPYAFSWDSRTVTDGAAALVAKAYDAANNSTNSATVTVTVGNAVDSGAPVANITSPANGATVTMPVTINANATDNVGIASLQLFIDGVLKSSTNLSSLSYSWNDSAAAAGNHTIVVEATDAAGNKSSRTISVNLSKPTGGSGADTTLPVVNITSLTDGQSLTLPAVITANATDNVAVTSMRIDIDGLWKKSSSTNSISYTWSSHNSGYTPTSVKVSARDAAGNWATKAIRVYLR